MENTKKQESSSSSDDSTDPNLKTETISEENDKKVKLRGDAIGDTVYSARFVLETLLKLQDNTWDEELESDMCSVWDMTVDEDVVKFLLTNNFIDLALDIIQQTTELRLTEILVGIMGNMCVYEIAAKKTIKANNFQILLLFLSSEDTATIIQVMRLFQFILFFEKIDCSLIMTENLLNQIHFILCSSKNYELLSHTIAVIQGISKRNNSIFSKINFLDAIYEAFNEILKQNDDLLEILTKNLSSYLKCLENACSYIKNETIFGKIKNFHNTAKPSVIKHLDLLKICLAEISGDNFMLYDTLLIELFLYVASDFLISLKSTPDGKVFHYFIDIYNKITENQSELNFTVDVCEFISEYLYYFIDNEPVLEIMHVCKQKSVENVKKIFVEDIILKYECSEKVKNVINDL